MARKTNRLAPQARNPRQRQSLRQAFASLDPEPVIAILEDLVTPARRARITEVLEARLDAVTVVMDAPHDPHNGAAILRSCEAFGVYTVHVVERSEPFIASNAVSKGTERWVDIITHANVNGAVESIAETGHVLVGTHPEGELLPEQLAEIPKLALVMGNEHDGICEELAAACSQRVRVPMRGFVESLNVSVTAAILMSYATSARSGDLPEPHKRRLYARALTLTVPRALEVLAARGISITF